MPTVLAVLLYGVLAAVILFGFLPPLVIEPLRDLVMSWQPPEWVVLGVLVAAVWVVARW